MFSIALASCEVKEFREDAIHVVGQRCKQTSMRWEKPGINAVLSGRCLLKNNAWDRYWYPDTKAA